MNTITKPVFDMLGNEILVGDILIFAESYGRAQRCTFRKVLKITPNGGLTAQTWERFSYGKDKPKLWAETKGTIRFPDRCINVTPMLNAITGDYPPAAKDERAFMILDALWAKYNGAEDND